MESSGYQAICLVTSFLQLKYHVWNSIKFLSSLSYKETEKNKLSTFIVNYYPPTYDNLKHTLDTENILYSTVF